jgi:hypothetical protein
VAPIPDLRSQRIWTTNHLTGTAECITGTAECITTADGITGRGDPAEAL